MKNRILRHFPGANITSRRGSKFYIADFSERTHGERGVEVHNIQPQCPLNPKNAMDCVNVYNMASMSIDFNIFDDHQFKANDGSDLEHCEGCFYPTYNHDRSWITMFEIKDCKRGNIVEYKDKAISQIVSATEIFRQKRIITSHRVYGLISIPKSKLSFNNTIFGMPPEYKKLWKMYKIGFAATNNIEIENDIMIRFKE